MILGQLIMGARQAKHAPLGLARANKARLNLLFGQKLGQLNFKVNNYSKRKLSEVLGGLQPGWQAGHRR